MIVVYGNLDGAKRICESIFGDGKYTAADALAVLAHIERERTRLVKEEEDDDGEPYTGAP